MNWHSYVARMLREHRHEETVPVMEEMGPGQYVVYDEMSQFGHEPLASDERARQFAFNETASPERRACLNEDGCIGDGAQVVWSATAGTWLCAWCVEEFCTREAIRLDSSATIG